MQSQKRKQQSERSVDSASSKEKIERIKADLSISRSISNDCSQEEKKKKRSRVAYPEESQVKSKQSKSSVEAAKEELVATGIPGDLEISEKSNESSSGSKKSKRSGMKSSSSLERQRYQIPTITSHLENRPYDELSPLNSSLPCTHIPPTKPKVAKITPDTLGAAWRDLNDCDTIVSSQSFVTFQQDFSIEDQVVDLDL